MSGNPPPDRAPRAYDDDIEWMNDRSPGYPDPEDDTNDTDWMKDRDGAMEGDDGDADD